MILRKYACVRKTMHDNVLQKTRRSSWERLQMVAAVKNDDAVIVEDEDMEVSLPAMDLHECLSHTNTFGLHFPSKKPSTTSELGV